MVEKVLLDRRAGRNDLDNVALHDALAGSRLGELLADGDLFAVLEQAGDVGSGRVVGNAAHRLALPVSEGQVQERAGLDGVLEEHLVEVSEPEEEDRVPMPRLDLAVLVHQEGPLGHGVAL